MQYGIMMVAIVYYEYSSTTMVMITVYLLLICKKVSYQEVLCFL